jgi:hypothetical protein
MQNSYPKGFKRLFNGFKRLNPYAQKTEPGILSTQNYGLSTKCRLAVMKGIKPQGKLCPSVSKATPRRVKRVLGT